MEHGITFAKECTRRVDGKWLAIVVDVAYVEELKMLETVFFHMEFETMQLSELSREFNMLFVAQTGFAKDKHVVL